MIRIELQGEEEVAEFREMLDEYIEEWCSDSSHIANRLYRRVFNELRDRYDRPRKE